MSQTLHENSPCPGNGSVVEIGVGQHTTSVSISGVGAIEATFQAHCLGEGCAAGLVGEVRSISGTTSKTDTFSFAANNDSKFWLQLISITPGATFSASVAQEV